MFGTLRKIEITDDLIMKIAREKFSEYNEGILDDQKKYIIGDWCNRSYDMLKDFNDLVCIFKKINYQCNTDNFDQYHDITFHYVDKE